MVHMENTQKRVRLTISVSPEVHAAFQRMATASGLSISRAMGDWLGDSVEAAEFMAEKLEEARRAPRAIVQELHAYAHGLVDETGEILRRVAQAGRKTAPDGPHAGRPGPSSGATFPPLCNTGGKVPAAPEAETLRSLYESMAYPKKTGSRRKNRPTGQKQAKKTGATDHENDR